MSMSMSKPNGSTFARSAAIAAGIAVACARGAAAGDGRHGKACTGRSMLRPGFRGTDAFMRFQTGQRSDDDASGVNAGDAAVPALAVEPVAAPRKYCPVCGPGGAIDLKHVDTDWPGCPHCRKRIDKPKIGSIFWTQGFENGKPVNRQRDYRGGSEEEDEETDESWVEPSIIVSQKGKVYRLAAPSVTEAEDFDPAEAQDLDDKGRKIVYPWDLQEDTVRTTNTAKGYGYSMGEIKYYDLPEVLGVGVFADPLRNANIIYYDDDFGTARTPQRWGIPFIRFRRGKRPGKPVLKPQYTPRDGAFGSMTIAGWDLVFRDEREYKEYDRNPSDQEFPNVGYMAGTPAERKHFVEMREEYLAGNPEQHGKSKYYYWQDPESNIWYEVETLWGAYTSSIRQRNPEPLLAYLEREPSQDPSVWSAFIARLSEPTR